MNQLLFSLFALSISLFSLFISYTSKPEKFDNIVYIGDGKIPERILVNGQQVFERSEKGSVTLGSSLISVSSKEYDSTELSSFNDPELTIKSLKKEGDYLRTGDYAVDNRGIVRKIRTARHYGDGKGSYILYYPHRVYLKELAVPSYTINGNIKWNGQ